MTGWTVRPAPGNGVLARLGDLVLLFGAEPDAAVTRLLEMLDAVDAEGGDGRRLGRRLAGVLSSLDEAPALVAFGPTGDQVAVLVHGDAVLVANTSGGEVRLDGSQSVTWVDRVIADVTSVSASLAGAGGGAPQRFRLDDGVVPAGGFVLKQGGGRVRTPPPPPVAVVAEVAPIPAEPVPVPMPPPAPGTAPQPVVTSGSMPEPESFLDEPADQFSAPAATVAPVASTPPVQDFSAPPVQDFTASQADQFSTPVSSAPPAQDFSAPPVQDFTSAPVEDFSSPPVQNFSAPPAQDFSAPPVQDFTAPPVQDFSSPPVQDFTAPPVQDFSSPMGEPVVAAPAFVPPPPPPPPAPEPPAPPAPASMPEAFAEPSSAVSFDQPVEAVPLAAGPLPTRPAEPGPAAGVDRGEPFESVLLAGPEADLSGLPMPEPLPMADQEPEEVGQEVLGIYCKNDHFNDPRAPYCGVCGISMVQLTHIARPGIRPPLGVLVLDDGATFRLDTSYVIGREPERNPEVADGRARSVRLYDPEGLVSRAHASIELADWDVVVNDLGSANGTYVFPPGADGWIRVLPNAPIIITPGTRVGLGRRGFLYESHTKSAAFEASTAPR
ncbi:hypothetical protein GCM10009765_41560 [Fodinicola feengrottensis]|uniref:FHA domain-containing protein n=1 Tax=Fodinicola feengrottensis TaxID=435914 RepID=A0ABN2HHN4_9ACTN